MRAVVTSQRLPIVALLLSGLLGLLIITQYAWPGTDGKAYNRIISGDGHGYYMYLPALIVQHNLHNQPVDNRYVLPYENRAANKYYVGTAVCMLPFFGLGHAIASAQQEVETGFTPPYHKAISLGGLAWLLLGLWCLNVLMRSYQLAPQWRAAVMLLLPFGTNLGMYALIMPSMSHVYSFAVIAAFAAVVRSGFVAPTGWKYALAAALFALVVLIRPVNGLVLLALPFLAQSGAQLLDGLRFLSKPKVLAGALAAGAALLFLQPLVWYIQTGHWIVWSYQHEGFHFLQPQLWKSLAGFRSGLFVYTPMLLLAVVGWRLLWRSNRWQAASFVGFAAVVIWVITSWWNWYYGASFGHRAFIDYYVFGGLLIGLLFHYLKRPALRAVAAALALCFLSLNVVQAHQYQWGIMDIEHMNWAKYRYIFLKTDKKHRKALGGCNDIWPYQANPELIFERETAFANGCEGEAPGQLYCQLGQREYLSLAEIPITAQNHSPRGWMAELSLSRLELEPAAASSAFIVVNVSNPETGTYSYSTCKVNEVPTAQTNRWETIHYTFELPRLRQPGDVVKLVLWNQGRKPFRVNGLKIKAYAIR